MAFGKDPLWYKDAVIYEVPIRAYVDSNGDGIGDFRGLTDRLDYLQDLGITAIWVLPFFPSPLRDDGYDVADYYCVNPIYGSLEDFQEFVAEAHRREIYVIIELVINHTSDRHPWFQRARRAPQGSVERDFYVWSETPDRYRETRIIFQDFEASNWTWDAVAGAYYWHRFYAHQPDLNFDSPAVQQAVLDVLDFWLGMGVDGLRLDAVPYLYERDCTNCENLPETHAFLQALRRHTDTQFPHRMLLAEANQWPEDAVQYFGTGNECHMNFHFPLMPRLFMALHMEDNFPIVDILQQTPSIPDSCQWAIFLRNHDELTLEMVSDEDRDYMYRVYARDPQARLNLGIRRRLTPLLGNSRRKVELLTSLLLSLPGTPVLYYGDEIGMGDNIYLGDRNGVRTPMQWSGDRNAGFSKANPQKLYAPVIVDPEYHYESVNAESQRQNPSSLWWWTKRILAVRQRHRAFSRGTIMFLHTDNRKVLAFVRSYQGNHLLIVVNLSRFTQSVQVDLSGFQHMTPVEMFGRSPFPEIKEEQYFLSLGAHNFYWFTLEPARTYGETGSPRNLPRLRWPTPLATELNQAARRQELEQILPEYWRSQPWNSLAEQRIQHLEIRETIVIPAAGQPVVVLLVQVEYREGEPATVALMLTCTSVGEGNSEAAIAQIDPDHGEPVLLCEALAEERFWSIPFEGIASRARHGGQGGEITAHPSMGTLA
ncbi:MAG: maltose alpha-D-glucosyltransferase [Oscillatoriales cyanobacterium SM2_2_1]|nr:maltose alpha-D-glucosyltransferase [Oscillatoriales cyanobacterium SM2_2_1]